MTVPDGSIQRVNVYDPGLFGSFTLSITLGGTTRTTNPISSASDSLTMAGNVAAQLNRILQGTGGFLAAAFPSTRITGHSPRGQESGKTPSCPL